MPYNKRKQKCKQSDGTPGNYVLSYTTKKGEKRRACHTSQKKMQGQIASIEAEADESDDDVLSELRQYIRETLQSSKFDSCKSDDCVRVRGYVKPSSSFLSLDQWESVVDEILTLQKQGYDTRGGDRLSERLLEIVEVYFGYQYNIETQRYDLLTKKNVMDFIEDFANHRFWGLEREFGHYFPDVSRLKFAYFYSRGDMEPYVLMDDEFTMQLYGSTYNPKELLHYTSKSGLKRIEDAIAMGKEFDISTFTQAERPFFRSESNIVVKLLGNVRAGFRSDIKSVVVDTGRRACNMYRLEYPGRDMNNICYELESCDGELRTSLWNEYIATPIRVLHYEVR